MYVIKEYNKEETKRALAEHPIRLRTKLTKYLESFLNKFTEHVINSSSEVDDLIKR